MITLKDFKFSEKHDGQFGQYVISAELHLSHTILVDAAGYKYPSQACTEAARVCALRIWRRIFDHPLELLHQFEHHYHCNHGFTPPDVFDAGLAALTETIGYMTDPKNVNVKSYERHPGH